ncbi:TonB-dependent receptor [Pseudoxanthomonas gei]|nr:TonB-dependent receptor [Pseudoxanthomonas gei]
MPSHKTRTHSLPPDPLVLALRAALLALALPCLAVAQESAGPTAGDEPTLLETMVVTAQKREQQVEEVPIAITAYSGEFLDKLGITGLGQLAGYVPGLQVQEQSPNNPGFAIRGITSDSGDSTVQPRVSVFQDGVSISRSRGASVELFDMQRVEVLRGPQGTLFGRAAEVGAVHLIQNKARDENSGQLEVGMGAFDQRLLNGYFNASIAPDALFARVAVFHEERDGSIDNAAGGTLNGKDTTAVRASLGMRMGEAGSLDFILNYQHDTPPGTAFRSGTLPTRNGSTGPFDQAELNRGDELGLDRTVRGVTVLGSFPLNDTWALNTVTGWRTFDSHEEFDGDGSQLYALEFAEIAQGEQWSQELRLNFDDGERFAGFLGASYFFEDGSQRVPFRTDERSLVALLSQNPDFRNQVSGILGGVPFPIIPPVLANGDANLDYTLPLGLQGLLKKDHQEAFANYGTTRALDVFVDGTWHVNAKLDLSGGLRASWEQQTAAYQGFAGNGPTLLNGLGTGSPAPLAGSNILNLATDGRLERSEDFNSVVGRVAARYAFGDTFSGYATLARGRRPNVIEITPQGSSVLPAEVVDSYELGIKGNALGGRLVYDLAGYWYRYSNFQTLRPNPAGGTPFFIPTNGGNATANGIEASVTGELTRGLVVFANYAWTHARFDSTDDNGSPQVYAGNRFRLTPDHSAAVGLDWELPFGGGNAFYLRPSYTWKSKVYFEDDNAAGLEQGAYGLLNLRLGVRLDNDRWDIGVWGSNLADEEYLIDGGNTGRQFGTPTFVPGQPRAYGVTARVRF